MSDAPVMGPSPLAIGDARRLGQVEQHDTLAARNSRLAVGDLLTVRVRRFDRTAELQEFQVPYRKWMRVLDALNWIADHEASDLAYRWFCGSKMCGTCAVRMNGREVLACWEAVEPDMTLDCGNNAFGESVLQFEHVGDFALEAIGPNMST